MSSTTMNGNDYNNARIWQIAFFTLNNTSSNLHLFILGFVSYYATGLVGLAVMLTSTLLMAARIFDGIIGYHSAFPQVGEALTPSLFAATLVLAFGLPAFGLIVSIIAMNFYKLDDKKMKEIQKGIAEIKEKVKEKKDSLII
ncbi:hypothetical protein [uncultured Metabacillus sp.]|uniref:hypothetical protein n=1 Tax=uncultured Metabacillus sp. TaxID=2860135 RepID=UPI00262C44FA|nr:hypothetical protein [uncultured Metabacillus sp.]